MKNILVPFKETDLHRVTRSRTGESRIGDHVSVAGEKWQQSVGKSNAQFVLFGIPEDIGVRANFGRPGAYSAYPAALQAFLNQQQNPFLDGGKVKVLGEIFCADLMRKARKLEGASAKTTSELRGLVAELDERVTAVTKVVFDAGKIPLVIGGGHNNAYGIIRALSQNKSGPVNVINCDPHLDFREMEGRHSGNSFSYAFNEGYLMRYAVLGMHEQYNNRHVLDAFREHSGRLFAHSFESVFVREERTFRTALAECAGFVKGNACGLEMDLDSVTNMPSSARTSSGISPLQARRYIHYCAANLDCAYLHIAEGAPVLSHIRADMKTGKFIAYLLSDFIKARNARLH